MARPKAPLTRVVTVAEPHGRRFRNKYIIDGQPKPVTDSFETEQEAKDAAAKFRREHADEQGPTVTGLYERWIEDRRKQGRKEADCIQLAFNTMCGEVADWPAASVTKTQMESAYEKAQARISKYGRPVSVATHQEALKWTKLMWAWGVEKGLVRKNPCAGIKPVGRRKKRKPQIETFTELFKFRDRAFELAEGGDRVALGVLVSLYNGPRSGEVRGIEARDIDEVGGNRVVIDGTKTQNAYRSIRVRASRLWDLLLSAAKAAASPTEQLVPHSQQTLLRRVKEIGLDIGMPEASAKQLTFQSLRGMAASLATQGDAAAQAIVQLLGQGSENVMKGHYATPASQLAAQEQASFRILGDGRGADQVGPEAAVAGFEMKAKPSQPPSAHATA